MAQTNTGPLVPLDILENIIDASAIIYSESDSQRFSILRSFALVCHAALPMCRKHLFASVVINFPFLRRRTISSLYKLLTESPDLGPYIRKLSFNLSHYPLNPNQQEVSKMSRKLTRLQSLELCNLGHGYIPPWTDHRHLILPLLHLPTITRLALYSIKQFLISDLIPCVSLKDLQIRLCSFHGGNVQATSVRSNSIILQKFACAWNNLEEAIDPIYRVQYADGKLIFDFSHLKETSMSTANCLDLHSLEGLFGNCHQLVDVRISFYDASLTLKGLFSVVKASLQTLKYLRVKFPVDERPKCLLDPFAGLCSELEKMSGRNVLESLELDIHLSKDYNSAQRAEWEALEKILMVNGGFSALRRVSLVFTAAQSPRSGSLDNTLQLSLLRHFKGLASHPSVDLQMQVEVHDP